MTHEEKAHNAVLTFLEMIEVINRTLEVCNAVTHVTHEQLITRPDWWATVQEAQKDNIDLLETFRMMIQAGSKAVDNEALFEHAQAVMLAED